MPYFYLTSTVFLFSFTSIFGKIFTRSNEKYRGSESFYNFFLILSVFAGWCVLFFTKPSFDATALIYSVIFGLSFVVTNLGLINALKHGPATLTALFLNLSLIVSTVWGFFFWDAVVSTPVIIGLVLVVIAIPLCLFSGNNEGEKSVSLKWMLYALLVLIGNSGCTISQRTYQMISGGEHGNMMMMCAIGIAVLFYLILFMRGDRSDVKPLLKHSLWIPVMVGISNVIQNLFVMIMSLPPVSDVLSSSLIYPVIAVGGLALVTIVSIFIFKERMRWWQWVGVVIGAVSVALLSI